MGHRVVITYCVKCQWLLRAQWYAGELLQSFAEELDEVALRPAARDAEAGVFRIEVDGAMVWNRKREGGFAEITELKRRVRDRVAPDRSLGHADRGDRGDRGARPDPGDPVSG